MAPRSIFRERASLWFGKAERNQLKLQGAIGPDKVLRMAAMTLGRSDHALGAFYRRLGARIGKAKAITATARKLALLVYRVLKHKILYQEQTADEYDQRQRARIFRGLRKRASSLGFALVDTTTGLVME